MGSLVHLLLFALATTTAWRGSEKLRCVCTTPQCRETGDHFCSTTAKCYTQYLQKGDGKDPVIWGCTSGDLPLQCENRLPSKVAHWNWPYLLCCDSEHFCNKGTTLKAPPWLKIPDKNGSRSEKVSKPRGAEDSDGLSSLASRLIPRTANSTSDQSCRKGPAVAQPLVVGFLLGGLLLLFAVLTFGFRMLRQQSRYIAQICPRIGEGGGYVKAQTEKTTSVECA